MTAPRDRGIRLRVLDPGCEYVIGYVAERRRWEVLGLIGAADRGNGPDRRPPVKASAADGRRPRHAAPETPMAQGDSHSEGSLR